MKRVAVPMAIAIGFSISGCTGRWLPSRPDVVPFGRVNAFCESGAEEKYPVKNEVAVRTVYVKHQERCKKDEKCDGKYKEVERQEIESYVIDVNRSSREAHFNACMRDNGWYVKYDWFWRWPD